MAEKFEVVAVNLMGNPNVGVYIHATDKYVIIPEGIEEDKKSIIREVLGLEPIEASINSSRLIGVFVGGNERGLLLPSTVPEDEVEAVRRALGDGVIVEKLPSRNNAVGNLIAANSRAALVYPGLEREALRVVRDVLDVEVEARAIAGVSTVGSAIVVTNRGGIVHPDVTEEELEFLTSLFGVPVLTGTVNFGVAYVRTGLVANSKGALVGAETSGPEIARIQMALGGGVGGERG